MAGINFDVTANNADFIERMNQIKSSVDSTVQAVESGGQRMDSVFANIGKLASLSFAGVSVKEFINKMIDVRSYFQDIESSMKIFLGSEEKANQFTKQLQDYAYYNMFEFSDLADASKQLIAYGNDATDVIDIIDKLSNIATATKAPLSEMISLYNNAKSIGSVGAQQMQSWGTRGLALKKILKEMGEEASSSTISFDQLNKILDHVTSEGGMFHGIMDSQMNNISASIGQLEDNISLMFNEIGQNMQEPIRWTIDQLGYLVDNYKQVAKVIAEVTAAYGLYKAVLITTTTVQNVANNYAANEQIKGYQSLIDGLKDLTDKEKEVIAQREQDAAQRAMLVSKYGEENGNELANLMEQLSAQKKVLEAKNEGFQKELDIISAQEEELNQKEDIAKKAVDAAQEEVDAIQDRINATQEYINAAQEEGNTSYEAYQTEELQNLAIQQQTAEEKLSTAQKELNTVSEEQNTLAKERATVVEGQNTVQTKLNTIATQQNTIAAKTSSSVINLLKGALAQLKTVCAQLWATLAANPLAVVAAAIAATAVGVYHLATMETEAEKATKKLKAAHADAEAQYATEKGKIDKLFNSLQKAKEGSTEYKKAKEEIFDKYKDYLKDLGDENTALNDQAKAYEAICKGARKAAMEKAKSTYISDNESTYTDKFKNLNEKVRKLVESRFGKEYTDNNWDSIMRVLSGEAKGDNGFLSKFNLYATNNGIGTSEVIGNLFQDKIREYKEATDSYNDFLDKADKMFAVPDKYKVEDTRASQDQEKGIKERTAELKKAYEKEQKEYDEMLKKNDTKDALENKKKLVDSAKTAYDDALKLQGLDAKTTSTLTKTKEKQSEKLLKIQDDMLKLQRSNEQTNINLIDDAREKQMKQVEQDYQTQLDNLKSTATEFAKTNTEAGQKATESMIVNGEKWEGLTKEQVALLKEGVSGVEEVRAKAYADMADMEAEAMNSYLEQWGTYQEQKLAIAREYAKKISEATTEGEKLSLQRERDSKISSLNAQNVMGGVDLSMVFSNVGNVVKDLAEKMKQKIDEYMSTDEFKKLTPENQKVYIDARNKLQESTGSSKGLSSAWNDVKKDVAAYRTAIDELNKATEAHTTAVNNVEKAEEKLKKLQDELKAAQEKLKNATGDVADEIQKKVNELQGKVTTQKQVVAGAKAVATSTGQTQTDAEGNVQQAQDDLTTSTNNVSKSMQNLNTIIGNASSGTMKGFADAVGTLIHNLTTDGDAIGSIFGELGSKITGIIGAILDILDMLGDDPAGFIYGLISGVGNTVGTIIKDLPNIFVSIWMGLRDLVVSIFRGVGDLWAGVFGVKTSNSDWVAEETEKLTNSNTVLKNAIDDLKETIEETSGAQAVTATMDALEKQEEYIKNTQQILATQMREWGDRDHSNDYYLNKDLNNGYRQLFNDALKEYAEKTNTNAVTIQSAQNLYDLSPETLDWLRKYKPDLWNRLLTDGKKDKSEYWENLADLADSLSDIQDALNETLTQTTFSDLKSSFVDALSDMEASAEDFSESFEEMMYKAMLNSRISDVLDDDIQAFYDKWTAYAKDATETESGLMTDQQLSELADMWTAITEEGLSIRDQIASFTGYDSAASSQSASSKGFTEMSEDTATELSGRFTALQVSNEVIAQGMSQSVEGINSLIEVQKGGNEILNNILLQSSLTNGYLEDIAKYTKPLLSFETKIDKLIDNTKNL